MSVDGINSLNSMRIGGLASGIDTDSIVESLVSIEQIKVDALEGEKTTLEWKQEAFRDIIDKLDNLKESQFEMSSDSIFSTAGYKDTSLINTSNDASRYLSVSANERTINGSVTINKIEQLAKASSVESSQMVVESITGDIDLSSVGSIALNGKEMRVELDGVIRDIAFTQDYVDENSFLSDFQTKLDDEFGAGRINASLEGGQYLDITASNSKVRILSGENDALLDLGIENGDQNRMNLYNSVADEFSEASDTIAFTINEETFSFSSTSTMKEIMDGINSSDANVTLRYSELSDKFTLASNETGASSKITIQNTSGDLFGALSHINITDNEVLNGQDAILYLDDETLSDPIYRSKNVFNINDISYNLKKTTNEAITLDVSDNIDDAYNKITNFVEDYNEVIDTLYQKINEKQYRDYKPLTDVQKEDMSETEIEKWEEKAKSGLLRGESSLRALADGLRMSAISRISGQMSLSEIGITGMGYTENGKLEIDETKLKNALSENLTETMNVFTAESDIDYSTDLLSFEKENRYEESGFARRIYDLVRDNIRTNRDTNGNKGILLEKAGLEGDVTEFRNIYTQRIVDMEERISDAIERMESKEDYYWKQFSAMETAIQKLNEQSAYLMSQFA